MSDLQPFSAEVGRVLDLVINSLYTHREIFLRELVSNASDACDKLRYESLSRPELLSDRPDLEIRIVADKEKGTLTVADDGIGMDREEIADNLGTIARSGTARFAEALSGDATADSQLIGRFGVGFYAAYMVADEIAVFSRKAGQDSTWVWRSDGRSGFTIEEADGQVERGTAVVLKLKEDAKEFLEDHRLRHLVRTYSDHVAFPILLGPPAETPGAQSGETEQINKASALWRRPRSEISDDEYTEFYRHTAHAFDEPFTRLHFAVEGTLAYTGLLFVPSMAPFDLYDPERRHGIKLYVKRVFITDRLHELMPRYLRFVAGVVDSEDLQLNVSRETLQKDVVVAKIRKAMVRRVLDELARIAEAHAKSDEGAKDYTAFWDAFGAVVKEGLYEDHENRERLLQLARFRSTKAEGWVSLADYVARMKPGQDAILTISGDNVDALKGSPQLEAARAKDVEVLLLTDSIDDFWVPSAGTFADKPFKSLTRDAVDLSAIGEDGGTASDPEEAAEDPELDRLLAQMKATLGTSVKDVRRSKRLTDSAVCLVADAGGFDLRFERFLKQHQQVDELSARVLEVNPNHALVRAMAKALQPDQPAPSHVEELVHLLLDQARVVEGEPVPDPGAFSRRMSRFLETSLTPTG